ALAAETIKSVSKAGDVEHRQRVLLAPTPQAAKCLTVCLKRYALTGDADRGYSTRKLWVDAEDRAETRTAVVRSKFLAAGPRSKLEQTRGARIVAPNAAVLEQIRHELFSASASRGSLLDKADVGSPELSREEADAVGEEKRAEGSRQNDGSCARPFHPFAKEIEVVASRRSSCGRDSKRKGRGGFGRRWQRPFLPVSRRPRRARHRGRARRRPLLGGE